MMFREQDVADLVARAPDGASPPPRRRLTKPVVATIVVAALFGAGICAGIHRRAVAEAKLQVDTIQDAVPLVDVVSPRHDATDQELVLPGQTMAFADTPIYARTNGYLKRWFFDIGAHVRQGQLLAQIETPELDDQLRQPMPTWIRRRPTLIWPALWQNEPRHC
jgi:multidrug efflux pump subunit AcrA (membrane-fusion protein)